MTDAAIATGTDAPTDGLSVVVERELPFPPARVWRALTEPGLIAEWLMENAFAPVVGHRFDLRAEWGSIDCEVRAVEPGTRLAYSWDAGELRSLVTWSLAPVAGGTRLRMEQTGFRRDQPRYYGGAKAGWPRFLDALAEVLARMD
jgi:uncharacterized protein YndB with AHSA1/START domain